MNTQGKVNKRLFSKTELATQKVELAIIDEVKGLIKEAQKLSNQMKQNADKAEKVFQSANKENKKLRDKIDTLKRESMDKFIKSKRMFKELGISPPQGFVKSFDEMSKIYPSRYVSQYGNLFVT